MCEEGEGEGCEEKEEVKGCEERDGDECGK